MLREFLSNITLLELPIVAMSMFLLLFLGVLWRVSQRSRTESYRRMSRLPLEDDHEHFRVEGPGSAIDAAQGRAAGGVR